MSASGGMALRRRTQLKSQLAVITNPTRRRRLGTGRSSIWAAQRSACPCGSRNKLDSVVADPIVPRRHTSVRSRWRRSRTGTTGLYPSGRTRRTRGRAVGERSSPIVGHSACSWRSRGHTITRGQSEETSTRAHALGQSPKLQIECVGFVLGTWGSNQTIDRSGLER